MEKKKNSKVRGKNVQNMEAQQDDSMEEEIKPFSSLSVVDYYDTIEEMFSNTPDKRKKEYKLWRDDINKLIADCNKLAKNRIYNPVK